MSTMLRTFAAAAMLAASQASAATGDWTQYGYDSEGRRNNTKETSLSKQSVSGLKLAWTANIGFWDRGSAKTHSTVVANGILYVGNDKLYAFDAVSGAPAWQAPVGPIDTTPAVVSGLVIVNAHDGHIHAFDAESGVERWSVGITLYVETSPVVARGVVYAGDEYDAYAITARTGQVLWTRKFKDAGMTPAVANGIAYFGGNETFACDAKTGRVLWHGGRTGYAPVFDNGKLYSFAYPAQTFLLAVDAHNGSEIWEQPTEGNSSFAIARGKMHMPQFTYFADFDETTGAQTQTTNGVIWMATAPAIANGVLYAGGLARLSPTNAQYYVMAAYDAENDKKLWQAPTAAWVESAPTVANGMLYVVDDGGTLYAYGLDGGTRALQHK